MAASGAAAVTAAPERRPKVAGRQSSDTVSMGSPTSSDTIPSTAANENTPSRKTAAACHGSKRQADRVVQQSVSFTRDDVLWVAGRCVRHGAAAGAASSSLHAQAAPVLATT